MVSINFTDGRKFLSRPITVGMEKRLARYGRDSMEMANAAGELQETAAKFQNAADSGNPEELIDEVSSASTKYNGIMDRMEALLDTRDEIIIHAFSNQFTLGEYEEQVTKEEAGRIIRALQGVGDDIISKNA